MKTILIAEDDETVRNNLEIILSSNNFQVYTASDGIECLKAASEIAPDLIISDIMMPGINGTELLEKLRNDSLYSSIPFIFLTAKSSYDELREGMALGADDYLFKPFTVKDLLESVNKVLEKHEKCTTRMKVLRDNIALTVPHEFRTPLLAILGYSQLLKEEITGSSYSDEIKQMINSLSDSAIRFNSLVQKFTNYTNVVLHLNDEESLNKIRNRSVIASRLFIQEGVLKVAKKYRRVKDLELSLEDSLIRYDETYLSFIVEELVDNAIRYSERGSSIRITGSSFDDRYVLTIRDEGIGMTADQIAAIDAFNQFSRDAMTGKSGNGIGLITVKKIAEKTGLDFSIESVPGKFTQVKISLALNIGHENSL